MMDFSAFHELLPLFSFLVVFALIFVVLQKIKVVENVAFQIGIAFLLAVMFVTAVGARAYLQSIVPFFAVLLVCLFFVLVFIMFVGKDVDALSKGVGVGFTVVLALVFIGTAVFLFGPDVQPYYERFRDSPRLYGAVVILVTALVVGWFLTKGKGK